MNLPRLLYHWTDSRNLTGILADGLRPDLARGALQAVWSCHRDLNWWALPHVAAVHGLNPDDMICIIVRTGGGVWHRTGTRGVFTSRIVVPPNRIKWVVGQALRFALPPSELGGSSGTGPQGPTGNNPSNRPPTRSPSPEVTSAYESFLGSLNGGPDATPRGQRRHRSRHRR